MFLAEQYQVKNAPTAEVYDYFYEHPCAKNTYEFQ